MTNTLYYGDNLPVLREHVADESVDLIYLDPPFNSNANYSILFKSPEGHSSEAQIEAFEDTWHWNESAEQAFDEVMKSGNTKAFDLLNAMRSFLGENDMMAYLAMMTVRLLELHRVLKPTGSLYLHCDPTAGHYLKLLLDGVFGKEQFLNEISWKRTFAHGSAKRFGPVHDIIFFYSKNGHNRWQDLKVGHDDSYVSRHFRYHDAARGESFQAISLTGAGVRKGESGQPWRDVDPTKVGRHWAIPRAIIDKEGLDTTGTISALEALDAAGRIYWPAKDGGTPRLKWFVSDLDGARLGDVWTDIPPISAQAKERLGYPTQKPLALLERIIAASSGPGDVVLDPFCGCGTAVHAAQKLGRQWLGIDVTHLAVSLIEKRMKDAFPGLNFTVEGRPQDLAAAQYLAARNKNEFEKWAVTALEGIPYRTGQGADGGIDGIIYFNGWDGTAQRVLKEKAIISVKGGGRKGVSMISELVETIARQKAAVGILFMAALPTREMESRAAAAGTYDLGEHGRYPRIQIITLAEFFNQGKRPRLPNVDRTSNRVAKREEPTRQNKLL